MRVSYENFDIAKQVDFFRMSQSYFHWMRVSYMRLSVILKKTRRGRNPTFTGCGFHIQWNTEDNLALSSVAILLSLDAGFISMITDFEGFPKELSQSYFHWMRVSYNLEYQPRESTIECRNPTFTGCGFHISITTPNWK